MCVRGALSLLVAAAAEDISCQDSKAGRYRCLSTNTRHFRTFISYFSRQMQCNGGPCCPLPPTVSESVLLAGPEHGGGHFGGQSPSFVGGQAAEEGTILQVSLEAFPTYPFLPTVSSLLPFTTSQQCHYKSIKKLIH